MALSGYARAVLVHTRTLALCCALALSLASVEVAAAAPTSAAAASDTAKGKSKGKKTCKKGYKLKTVTKKSGKKVKVCKKKKAASKQPPPATGGGPPTAPLFEAPGKQLTGEAAKPFLQKYLVNSTFTDCVQGWPACGGFENRFSHAADATFYKCLLRPTSGSDVKSVGEYGFQDARVEPDGSWLYKELVYWYGNYTLFEWSVSTTGVVTGASLNEGGATPEGIGPLQYVGGVAKNCSY
ncbi:MAG TPA: hypothetical protein VHR18_01505 [Solirubrobacterales bacterium]|jgi:putative hemolysin|nr:hypothetical protein [Solirubrobacterales bacterium]